MIRPDTLPQRAKGSAGVPVFLLKEVAENLQELHHLAEVDRNERKRSDFADLENNVDDVAREVEDKHRSLLLFKLFSFSLKLALFRNLCVVRRIYLCVVPPVRLRANACPP